MFRSLSRSSLCSARRASATRYFHRITADFINHDTKGKLVVDKVPVIVGNPGEAYVLIDPKIGNAIRAASPLAPISSASVGDRCQLTYFHDSQHFGSESSHYPRLHVPIQIPRQTESNTSPATVFLSGKMYEIVLDGTPDAKFAEHASASAKNLEHVLDQLKDM